MTSKNGKILIAPEGGWGYMIGVSFILMFSTGFGPQFSFGLIYNDFLVSIGEGTSGLSIMNTLTLLGSSIAGIAILPIVKLYGPRPVALAGAFMTTVGLTLCVFVRSIYEVIAYNIIMGIGLGIQTPMTYTVFSSYFVKKRVFVLSTSKAIVGIVFMMLPLMYKWFMDMFGFRGTLLVTAAIGSHTILAALLLQPVELHMKLSKTEGQDSKEIENTEYDHASSALLKTGNTDNNIPSILISSEDTANEEKEGESNRKNKRDLKRLKVKSVSMVSLGSTDEAFNVIVKNDGKKGFWNTFSEYLDLSLLKDGIYINICFGISMVFFSETTFGLFFPLMLFNINYTTEQVALCLSATAAGDMAGRFIVVLISRFYSIKSRNIFLAGAVISFTIRSAINFFSEFYVIAAMSTVIGISKSFTHLTLPIILADHVPIEKYPASMGLNMMLGGVLNIFLGPLVGFIRDATQSYIFVFHLLNACILICIISWTVESLIGRRKSNKVSSSD